MMLIIRKRGFEAKDILIARVNMKAFLLHRAIKMKSEIVLNIILILQLK